MLQQDILSRTISDDTMATTLINGIDEIFLGSPQKNVFHQFPSKRIAVVDGKHRDKRPPNLVVVKNKSNKKKLYLIFPQFKEQFFIAVFCC